MALLIIILLVGALGIWWPQHTRRRRAEQIPQPPDLAAETLSLREAVADADRKARLTPNSGDAVGRLGMLYHANHVCGPAEQCYELATRLAARDSRWPYLLAAVRQETGRSEGVLEQLRRAVELAPDYAPAHLKLGDLLLKSNQPAAAEQEYRRTLQLLPSDPYALLGLARIAVGQGQWQAAESHLRRAVGTDPKFGVGHRLLATVYEKTGMAEKAAVSQAHANTCTRFRPAPDPWVDSLDDFCYDPTFLLVRADAARQLRETKRGLVLLRRAVKVAPDSAKAHLALGTALREIGDFDGAEPHLVRAVQLDPKSEEAVCELGVWQGAKGREAEAVKSLETALRINPASTTAYYNLGLVARHRGAEAAAAARFLRACELSDFRFDEAVENYVGCLVRTNQQAQAIEFLQRILVTRPTAARVWVLLARVHVNLKDPGAAADELRKGLSYSPYNAVLAQTLAGFLMTSPQASLEDAREAITLAKRALEFGEPRDAMDTLDTLATAYLRTRDVPQATAALTQAMEMARQAGNQAKVDAYAQRIASVQTGQAAPATRGNP